MKKYSSCGLEKKYTYELANLWKKGIFMILIEMTDISWHKLSIFTIYSLQFKVLLKTPQTYH